MPDVGYNNHARVRLFTPGGFVTLLSSLVAARADHVFSETKAHTTLGHWALPTGADHTEAGRGGNIPWETPLWGSESAQPFTTPRTDVG